MHRALLLLLAGLLPLHADWRTDADSRIEHYRKGDFVAILTPPPPSGTEIRIRQTRHDFLFGVAVAEQRLVENSPNGENYREYLISHFNALVAENSMKWYAVEKSPGQSEWDGADALVAFSKKHHMPLRGHCLFWAKPKFVQPWVQALGEQDLRLAVETHLQQIVGRYAKDVICWDVNNEMLDGTYYQDRLGPEIRADFFRQAHRIAPDIPLFVNEYGILDSVSKTKRYLELIRQLREQGAPVGGIGIQEHAAERFVPDSSEKNDGKAERSGTSPLIPSEVWSRLDELSQFGLPIHLTEISAKTPDPERRAQSLEMLYRVGFAHPNVEAIFLWGFWEKAHWLGSSAALVDKDWNTLPAGRRLAILLNEEWTTQTVTKVDGTGKIKFRGFYGTYLFTWTRPDGQKQERSMNFPAPRHPPQFKKLSNN